MIAEAIPDADGGFAGYGEEFTDGNGGGDRSEVGVLVEESAILGAQTEVCAETIVDTSAEEEGGAVAGIAGEGSLGGREDQDSTSGVGEWFEVTTQLMTFDDVGAADFEEIGGDGASAECAFDDAGDRIDRADLALVVFAEPCVTKVDVVADKRAYLLMKACEEIGGGRCSLNGLIDLIWITRNVGGTCGGELSTDSYDEVELGYVDGSGMG